MRRALFSHLPAAAAAASHDAGPRGAARAAVFQCQEHAGAQAPGRLFAGVGGAPGARCGAGTPAGQETDGLPVRSTDSCSCLTQMHGRLLLRVRRTAGASPRQPTAPRNPPLSIARRAATPLPPQGPLAGPSKPPELVKFTTAQSVGEAMKVRAASGRHARRGLHATPHAGCLAPSAPHAIHAAAARLPPHRLTTTCLARHPRNHSRRWLRTTS